MWGGHFYLYPPLCFWQFSLSHCEKTGLPFVFNEAESDGMESCGGGNQLYKSTVHALIQQESSPESVLWLWPRLIGEQEEVGSEVSPNTELGSGHLS